MQHQQKEALLFWKTTPPVLDDTDKDARLRIRFITIHTAQLLAGNKWGMVQEEGYYALCAYGVDTPQFFADTLAFRTLYVPNNIAETANKLGIADLYEKAVADLETKINHIYD